MHVARSVRGDDDKGWNLGAKRAHLRDRDGVLRQDLEEERLELVVSSIDLVDQQHRRRRSMRRSNGSEQRTTDEEALGVELALEMLGRVARGQPNGLGRPQVQQLPSVVPLVDGLRCVEPLVALESDQLTAGPAGQRLGDLCLAYPGLAFEKERALHPAREEHRRRQPCISEVALRRQGFGHLVHGAHPHGCSPLSVRSTGGLGKRPAHENPRQVATEVGRRVQVGGRLGVHGGQRRGIGVGRTCGDRGFHCARP